MEKTKADDFEELIEFLVRELAINDWNKGLSVAELLGRIETFYGTPNQTRADAMHTQAPDEKANETLTPMLEPGLSEKPSIDRNFKTKVWDALISRDDIIVGEGSVLTLDEVEALPVKEPSNNTINHDIASRVLEPETEISAIEYQPRIHVGQSRLWLVLTGHDVDKTKLPFSEWQLLLAIAAAGKNGILQADARKETRQDKRSVPRRTDFLAQKGYIEKKQVLAFSQKTSLLTHKIFLEAGSVQQDIPNPAELPVSILTQDLKPVPGHEHWTGVFVDTEMVARTAVAIIRAWGVIRRTHILAKMNIHDLRLRKTLERTIRKLFELKVCKRVSALLPDNPKIFKDCVKFLREPTEDEWSHFKKKLTSQGFKNRPSRAKPKSEHKPRIKKHTKSKLKRSTVADSSDDAFYDGETDDTEGTVGDFFDGEDVEAYDAAEKPTLMTSTKESVEDTIEEAIQNNPGDEGISEEDLLAEVDILSKEELITLFMPFDINSAGPSDVRTLRIVREPIEKAGKEIHQYYMISSFKKRVSSEESSWDGVHVLRYSRAPESGTPDREISDFHESPTTVPLPNTPSPSVINTDMLHTNQRTSVANAVLQNSDNGSEQAKPLQLSTPITGSSIITPFDTLSRPFVGSSKKPRGRPKKLIPATGSKDVMFTSHDQLQRQAGVSGVYFDLPEFQLVQERTRRSSGMLPRGRKPKQMMMMIKSEKLKDLDLTTKVVKPHDKAFVEIEGDVPLTPKLVDQDRQQCQGTSSIAIPNVAGQNDGVTASKYFADSAGKFATSTVPTYTSPYQIIPITPAIPSPVFQSSQLKSAVANGPEIAGSLHPPMYISPYAASKAQVYNSPYKQQPEAANVPVPQSQSGVALATKTSQLCPNPSTSQYRSPYAIIGRPSEDSIIISRESQSLPGLQSSSPQPAQTKQYISPYAKASPSPSLSSANISPTISDQEQANNQLVAEIEAAAHHGPVDAYETVFAEEQEKMDMDINSISENDPDDVMQLLVSRNDVTGNLCLNDSETELTFLPLDSENIVSKITIEISHITAVPTVDTETGELVILTKETLEESDNNESEDEFKFGFSSTLIQEIKNFSAKIATAMTKKGAKSKRAPLPPWAFPVPNGGIKPFRCDQCTGAWKNYEGIKYHKTRARVACNPNWTRPPTPPPVEMKKRRRDSVTLGEHSPEEAARIAAQSEQDGTWPLLDDNGRPKRRRPYRRRQTKESNVHTEFIGSQESKEHLARNATDQVGISNATNVTGVEATGAESPSKIATVEKRVLLATKAKLKYPTLNDRDNIERRTGPVITQQRKEVIMDLIEANGGAFPGDQGLWFAMHAAWMRKYPHSAIQDYKYCNQAVTLLEDSSQVTKVKFSFRDQKGRMRTRAVVTKKGVDPLSQSVTDIKAKIKEIFPKYYCPPTFAPPEPVLSMLEARESRPSEEERQRRMLEKEQHEDPEIRAEKDAIALEQARILATAIEKPKQTTYNRESISDNEDEIALLSAPFYAPDPDADGETDVEYHQYMGRRGRKRRMNHSSQRIRSDSFREGQSSRMKALWASLRAQGVTLKGLRSHEGTPMDGGAMLIEDSDSEFVLPDGELGAKADLELKCYLKPQKFLLTDEEQSQADYTLLHGWQTAPSFIQNTDGSWAKESPKPIDAKIHIHKSVLPEPVTYLQTADNPAWSFRPFGHGVNSIHVFSLKRTAGQVLLKRPKNSFRPVIVHKAKHHKSRRIVNTKNERASQGFIGDDIATRKKGRESNSIGGHVTKKSETVRWDEESDDQRPYGFTVIGEEIPWPDFKPLPLPDSRLRTKSVMPDWSSNPGLDSLTLHVPNFGLPNKAATGGFGTTDVISATSLDLGFSSNKLTTLGDSLAATTFGKDASFRAGSTGQINPRSDNSHHIEGLFSRSAASFKDILPKNLESIVSQVKQKRLPAEEIADPAYTDFVAKVTATAEWEQAIGGRTLLGMGNITPGEVYINHTTEVFEAPQTIKPPAISWLADNSFTLETLPYQLLVVDPVELLLSTSSRRKPRRVYQRRQRTDQASSYFGMVEATKSDFEYLSRKQKLPGSRLIGQPRSKRAYRRAAQSKDFRVRRHTSLPIDIHGLKMPANDPDFHVSVSYHGISGHRKRTNERTVISEALDDRLIVAVVVVRTLTGGLDQSVDWVLVSKLFPQCTMNWVRRHFTILAEKHAKRIDKMTEDFQTAYLAAYEVGEVPRIDYDHLLDYDWNELIDWAMERTQLVRSSTVDLPNTREKFDQMYELQDIEDKNWGDSYFSSVLPLHKRIAHASAGNTTLPVSPPFKVSLRPDEDTLRIARSWAKASTLTPAATFNPATASAKLRGLGPEVMRDAITQLVDAKAIMPVNKGRPVPGRGFEPTDVLTAALAKILSRVHYDEAVIFKGRLDNAFKRGEIVMLEYTACEGEILATTNLQAARRTVQTGHRIPMNKFGLTEGNYQTKKMNKTKLLFDIQISPSDTYIYDDAHPLVLSNMLSIDHNPPPKPNDGALPLWYDINDQLIPGLWRKVVGAVLATVMQRPGIEAKEVARLLSPALEEWEARLVLEWAFGVDALKEIAPGTGIEGWTVGEWWWWVAGKI